MKFWSFLLRVSAYLFSITKNRYGVIRTYEFGYELLFCCCFCHTLKLKRKPRRRHCLRLGKLSFVLVSENWFVREWTECKVHRFVLTIVVPYVHIHHKIRENSRISPKCTIRIRTYTEQLWSIPRIIGELETSRRWQGSILSALNTLRRLPTSLTFTSFMTSAVRAPSETTHKVMNDLL